jgi:hypothetical protein
MSRMEYFLHFPNTKPPSEGKVDPWRERYDSCSKEVGRLEAAPPGSAARSMEHERKEKGPRIHQQRVAEIQGAILYGPDGKSIADVIDNLLRNDWWGDEHPVNYLTISSPSYEEASEMQQVLKEHDASFIGFYSGVDMAPFF